MLNVFILGSSWARDRGMVRSWLWMGKMHGASPQQSRAADQVFQSPLANTTSFGISLKGSRVRLLLQAFEGFCLLAWKNSKRNIVVSMQLSETGELSSALCLLMDVLHSCKCSLHLTNLGPATFNSHKSFPPWVQRWWTPRPRVVKPLCVRVTCELGLPAWLHLGMYAGDIWEDLGNKPIFPPTDDRKINGPQWCTQHLLFSLR